MNFTDKKTLMIAGGIAGAAIIILLAVVLLGGKKKGADQAGMGMGGGGGAGQQGGGFGAGGGGGAGQQGGGAGQMGGAGGQMGGAGNAAMAGAPVPGAVDATAAGAPRGKPWGALMVGSGENSSPYRRDPLVFLEPPPRKITPEELVVLPAPTLVQGGFRPSGPVQVSVDGTVANRRVAGVKFNGGAWAILDDGTNTFVVKPGDVVDGWKINSISREAIYVTDPQGQKWVVPLRGAGPGAAAAPVSSRRASGM